MKHNIVGDTVDDQGNTSDSLESSGDKKSYMAVVMDENQE